MDIKAFLMQKFECSSSSRFEIYVTKFHSKKRNESSNSAIYLCKMGSTLTKLVFMSRIVLLDQKLTPPMSISAIFK